MGHLFRERMREAINRAKVAEEEATIRLLLRHVPTELVSRVFINAHDLQKLKDYLEAKDMDLVRALPHYDLSVHPPTSEPVRLYQGGIEIDREAVV